MQGRTQCLASEKGKRGTEIVSLILDKRKDGSIRVTIAPQEISTEPLYPLEKHKEARHKPKCISEMLYS